MLFRELGEEALEPLDGLLDAHRRCFRAVGGGLRTRRGALGAIGRIGLVAGARGREHERKHYEACAGEMAGAGGVRQSFR